MCPHHNNNQLKSFGSDFWLALLPQGVVGALLCVCNVEHAERYLYQVPDADVQGDACPPSCKLKFSPTPFSVCVSCIQILLYTKAFCLGGARAALAVTVGFCLVVYNPAFQGVFFALQSGVRGFTPCRTPQLRAGWAELIWPSTV